MAQDPDKPEQPRVEPEIIPPDRGERRGWPPRYGYSRTYGTQRLYVTRIGPFGFALLMLVVGLLAAVMLLIVIGTALIWIPVVVALLILAAISGLLRRL